MLLNSYQNEFLEAGCDEAGRGCLAGSVFAAAVILPSDFHQLRTVIEREAIAWCVKEVTAERIDKINILNASIEGMNLAIKGLSTIPGFIVVDGNRFHTDLDIPFRTIVKGDGKYANIAAASVLAKTHRDEYMMRLAEEYPMYGWAKNKGYPTREHRLAIREHGLTPYHRLSFNLAPEQLELF